MSAESFIREMLSIAEEVKAQEHYRDLFLQQYTATAKDPDARARLLEGKTKEEKISYYQHYILELLDRLDNLNSRVEAELEDQPRDLEAPEPQLETVLTPSKKPANRFYIGKATRRKYLQEIGANEYIIERLKGKKKYQRRPEELVDFTIYQTSVYGKISNLFCRGLTESIVRSYPQFYANLSHSLRMSDIRVLSKTYVSMQLFTSFLSLFLGLMTMIFVSFFLSFSLIFTLITSISAAVLLGLAVFAFFYYYPASVVGSRNKQIRNDLPFVTIHMAAVAGAGSKPTSIFKLLLSSGEYKGLEGEIKKIVNYLNLFGYDLSTALRTVATTTPNPRFKDLLNGMVSTIESGGSLKSYLQQIAEETMNTYRLERQKYVETLSTYSDIYTGVLIAAPLLFIVTLAIINVLGGTIAGLSVNVISLVGTFVVLPLLNVLFLLFLNIVQPES